MIITQRQKRHSKSCDFGNSEKTIENHNFYVSQTPLTVKGTRLTEVSAGKHRILLNSDEVAYLKKRLNEITLP